MGVQGPMHGMGAGGPVARAVFLLFCLLLMLPVVASWVVFVVASWRGMKAHERIAGAKTIQDVHAPLRAVLKDLGDGHSVLRAPPRPPTPTRGLRTVSAGSR